MKPRRALAEAFTPEGRRLVLSEHDGAFVVSLNGQELMHERAHASEVLLGRLGVAELETREAARVLVGGLGLGFTLRHVLAGLTAHAVVEVVELIPAVVAWNRSFLRGLNGECLDDPRVTVITEDVGKVIRMAAPGTYDRVLLDVDNGPVAMVAAGNEGLYSVAGLRAMRRALQPAGRAVFWSAGPDAAFVDRLKQAGFEVEAVPAKVHEKAKRSAYVLYVATRLA